MQIDSRDEKKWGDGSRKITFVSIRISSLAKLRF